MDKKNWKQEIEEICHDLQRSIDTESNFINAKNKIINLAEKHLFADFNKRDIEQDKEIFRLKEKITRREKEMSQVHEDLLKERQRIRKKLEEWLGEENWDNWNDGAKFRKHFAEWLKEDRKEGEKG